MHDFAELTISPTSATQPSGGVIGTIALASSTDAVGFYSPTAVASTNGGGTIERIPDETWASWWDGGALWNGGGAFNNTLAGFSFEIVTYDADGAEASQATLHPEGLHADDLVFSTQATKPKEPSVLVEGLVITGKRLASEFEFARTIARLTPSYADDLVTTMGAVAFGAGPHRYVTLNQVGDTACDADEAWAALQQFAAPGAGPVSDGQVSNLPLFGPVQHSVDAAHMKIVNSTLPGHLFYPGTVTREVVVSNGKVYIQTTGTGTGQFAGINVAGSGPLWGSLDSQIAAYVDANDNGPDDC